MPVNSTNKRCVDCFLVFVSGYVVISQPRFAGAIDQYSWLSFALALTAALAAPIPFPGHLEPESPTGLASSLLFKLSQRAGC